MCIFRKIFLPLAAVSCLYAVETKNWQQGEMADFEKGNAERISLASDGRLTLAPAVHELFDASTAYLWALARDSKGNLYAGGGAPDSTTAKLFRIDPNGNAKSIAELDGLEIHAIAIDSRDRVYAATAPDGKVYRLAAGGKPEVFYDPHAKYIWSMVFAPSGDLYIATGDRGEIHRVTPAGTGTVFFKTEETHARSLAIDANGNLIVGTDPGGLILRVTPAGEGFVLYQSPKREITAVAVAPDGSLYAAAAGNKSTGAGSFPPAPVQLAPVSGPAPVADGSPAATTSVLRSTPSPLPGLSSSAPAISGGAEVYRIGPDGYPRKVWSNSKDIVYAIAFDAQGRPLLGAGNKGSIYRLDNDHMYTLLVNLPPTQVTAFCGGRDGRVYAVTGNIGKVYEIGPGLEKQGVFESEVQDAGSFSYWGRLSYQRPGAPGGVRFETRSGNLNRPQKNWSPWSPVPLSGDGGRTNSPPARFVQYRVSLAASSAGVSPEVTYVDLAYLPKNVAPMVEQVEITPANYRFPAPFAPVASSTPPSLNLPAMGQEHRGGSSALLDVSITPALQYAKGWMGARWLANDDNGDTLSYNIEIRGVRETTWKPLKHRVREKYFSWDSTAFPDGEYVVRISASDAPSNPSAEALSAQLESDPFWIDNTPPRIIGLAAKSSGKKLEISWRAEDALSVVEKAEYSVNGGDWRLVDPVTKLSDAPELNYRLSIDRPAGELTIAVRVRDEYANQSVESVVVK
ncbi:MAG: hypothetical protein ABI165_20610 [Bryobacteraceae bacterium]